ncbi:MAG: hypothetical protein MJY73_05005 [Bacteroidales bacterium]|nr:hypothetical protein [Bacteroidales bacterium]
MRFRIIAIISYILVISNCDRCTHHLGTENTINDDECIYFFTEGNVMYEKETTYSFNADTSMIIENMRKVCKDIDKLVKSKLISLDTRITDVSEHTPNDCLNISLYLPEPGETNILLEIVASRDYINNDTLVPIVENCLEFISEGNIPDNGPIKLVSKKNEIDLLTNQ